MVDTFMSGYIACARRCGFFSTLLVGALFALSGCSSGPGFSGDHINTGLQPRAAIQGGDQFTGQSVLWGGRIIHAEPQMDSTRLEVLAFPLRGNQQPDVDKSSQGRFLIMYPGYLEPADFRADRLITVVGRLEKSRTGQVGEATYRYPVVMADDLYLWPEQNRDSSEPRVHFGIGVGIFR